MRDELLELVSEEYVENLRKYLKNCEELLEIQNNINTNGLLNIK